MSNGDHMADLPGVPNVSATPEVPPVKCFGVDLPRPNRAKRGGRSVERDSLIAMIEGILFATDAPLPPDMRVEYDYPIMFYAELAEWCYNLFHNTNEIAALTNEEHAREWYEQVCKRYAINTDLSTPSPSFRNSFRNVWGILYMGFTRADFWRKQGDHEPRYNHSKLKRLKIPSPLHQQPTLF